MTSSENTWTLSAHSAATDFKLSLTPDVIDGVFKLMDLYEQGRDRFFEFETNYRVETAINDTQDSVAVKYDEEISPISPRQRQRIIIRLSFTFNSGIVELRRNARAEAVSQSSRRTGWLDIFHLPTISLWVDYAGVEHNDSAAREDGAELIFSLAVHESRNTLRPTILPFFIELVNRIGQRSGSNKPAKPSLSTPVADKQITEPLGAAISDSTLQMITAVPDSHVNLRVSLRIDRSELRLSCAPDSNAYVDLKWESGGFLASTTLGKEGLSTVAGSVSGIQSSLSHEFAELGRSCIEAGAKDMAFSVTLCPGAGSQQPGLSVVFDTQLSGQFRLDAFSAWLIFVSVWVDNAPKIQRLEELQARAAADAAGDPLEEMIAPLLARRGPRKLAVAVLLRFRSIDFDANIGVSRTHLEISPIIIRTTSNGEKTDIDIRIGTTKVAATGDVSGQLESSSLVFNTTRRSSRASSELHVTVLSMAIEGGDLSGNLFLADTNILRFQWVHV